MAERHIGALVVGGGIIGMSAAWRIAQLGVETAVAQGPATRIAASTVAAGMLAPVSEAAYGEEDLLALNLESARRYPEFLSDLASASGSEISAGPQGTVFAAIDRDQAAQLGRLYEFQQALGLEVEWLDRQSCRKVEPCLHPSTVAGVFAVADTAVDPRSVLAALAAALEAAGGETIPTDGVAGIEPGDRPAVKLREGTKLSADHVILAAGCWTGGVEGVPAWLSRAVRPVKGQILRLAPPAGEAARLSHVVRTEEVYIVPRPKGEVVVGATVEERGFSREVTVAAVYELLRAAVETVPAVRDMELREASAGLRPGTPDNAPLIGPSGMPGVAVAAGHFRNGVLLAPVTADAIARLVVKGEVPPEVARFSPLRFAE